MSQIKSIAITGKGGTGKTMIATLMIRLLSERFRGKVLAIDADSAMSLPYTLGIQVERTVSQLRKEVISPGQMRRKMESQSLGTWMSSILSHGDGFKLLTMGRPEEPGCFCAVNELLRTGIDSLVDDYYITVVDGEAGPEQLNRRVMKSIDVLLVVSDMSVRSIGTAGSIIKVAREQEGEINVKKAGLILNRVRGDQLDKKLVEKTGLEVLGWVPEDKMLNDYDRAGKPLFDLPNDSPCLLAVCEVLKKLIADF
jgi:CO dehydrogenase maturation factor